MHPQPTQPSRYIISRTAGTVGVLRQSHDGTLRPVRHDAQTSPTGFEFGYPGSGPADLARCLLIDYVGGDVCPATYQAFKHEVIARLDGDVDHHRLEAAAISAWLAEHEVEEAER